KPAEASPSEEPESSPPTGGSDEPVPGASRPTRTPSAGAEPSPGMAPRAPIGIFPRSQTEFAGTSAEGRRREPEQKTSDEVFAEDWWSHARPVFEIHGYFRTRGEL